MKIEYKNGSVVLTSENVDEAVEMTKIGLTGFLKKQEPEEEPEEKVVDRWSYQKGPEWRRLMKKAAENSKLRNKRFECGICGTSHQGPAGHALHMKAHERRGEFASRRLEVVSAE